MKRAIFARDPRCLMRCGADSETVNHRANRGMGGGKGRDGYANGCGICHVCNGRIESEASYAAYARYLGVKLRSWQNPEDTVLAHYSLGKIKPHDDETWEEVDD